MSKHDFIAVAIACVGSLGALAHATPINNNLPTSPTTGTDTSSSATRQAPIALQCTGSGSSDVASRRHSIRNTTGYTVPKGTRVYWKASDNGTGSLVLMANLAPNASVDVSAPGQTNGYSCTSYFYPGPVDFAVVGVAWTSATTATVQIKNLNPWVNAPASQVQVKALQCGTGVLAASVTAAVPAIGRLQTQTVSVSISHTGADYLEARANSNHAVPETEVANNTLRSADFGSNKSCTPQ